MLLVLSDEHREHLKFLTHVDVNGMIIFIWSTLYAVFSVVKEFCKISLDFIRKGVNRKVYQSAARECIPLHHGCYGYCVEKLDVDVATIQHGVEGLMYLITECSKLMVHLLHVWYSEFSYLKIFHRIVL